MAQAIASTFDDVAVQFSWSGDIVFVPYTSIIDAADELANYINNYKFAPGEPLNIVAHSDGGNVVKIASWMINHSITNLVDLGTPQNWDLPIINTSEVQNYCNVYSFTDPVQFIGASPIQWYGFFDALYDASLLDAAAWEDFLDGNYLAALQEAGASAYDDGIAVAYWLSAKVDPLANTNVQFASLPHSGLHTVGVWNQIVGPCGLGPTPGWNPRSPFPKHPWSGWPRTP